MAMLRVIRMSDLPSRCSSHQWATQQVFATSDSFKLRRKTPFGMGKHSTLNFIIAIIA